MISPPEEVTVCAAANVRQGVARGQFDAVLLSLPKPLTNVRAADASAAEISANVIAVTQNVFRTNVILLMFRSLGKKLRRMELIVVDKCRQTRAAVMPDDGHLLDLLFDWTPDEAIQRKILVETRQRLFGA